MLPIFTSHYSLGHSILTLAKVGSSKDNEPDSIVDLCIKNNFKDCFLLDSSISSFPEAYENFLDAKINLHYGIKIICCANIEDKSEESLNTNHKICIWAKSTQGYYDLIKIWSEAAVRGRYYVPRIDFNILKSLWTDNLLLTFPFYDSFLFENGLRNHKCIPDFNFTKPVFFIENNDLPFDSIVKKLVENFASENKHIIQEVQSIFYSKQEDIKAYQTFRCINKRSFLSSPKLDHFSSDTFSLEHYLNAIA